MWVWWAAVAVPGSARPAAAQAGFDLAITIDDLPWTAAGSTPAEVVAAGTGRILHALSSRSITATGFIVCDAMAERPGQVERWIAAGQSLGNHTQSHPDLNTTPVADWIEGVRSCDTSIRAAGADPTHFRYPMLHRGDRPESRSTAARAVAGLGYTVAPVTIDNSEWILASAYERAAGASDSTAMRRIGAAYLEHIRRATNHARAVSRERFDRDAAQILLLHANRLNADWLGELLDGLASGGARFIRLEAALADSVYGLEDDYIGPRGLSWLYRVAPARPDFATWDAEEEERVRREVEAIDAASRPVR